MNLAEFFIQIGVVGGESVKRLDASIKNVRQAVITMQIAFIGATYTIDKFISGTIKQGVALENFSTQTGLAINELNKWVSAGQKVNRELNFDTIKNNVAGLQKQLEQIKIGQGNIAPFQLLGINIDTNAFGVLKQLRENIKGLSNPQAVNLIQQLGLDANFINVLRLSEQEFDKLSQNNFLSGNQTSAIANLGKTLNDLKIKFQSLKDQAVVKLAPTLMKLFNDLQKWVNANGKKLIQTFTDIANIFSKIATGVTRVAGLFADLFQNILKTENSFTTLAVVVGALMLSFKPLSLLLIGLLLLLDDIAVWKMGGQSLFGDFYDGIEKIANTVKQIPGIENILKVGGAIAGIVLLTSKLGKLSKVLGGITRKAIPFVGAFYLIKEFGDGIKEKTGMPNFVHTSEEDVKEKVKWLKETVAPVIQEKLEWVMKSLGIEKPANSNVSNVNNITQNVYGTDAKATADYAVEGMEELLTTENQLKF